MLKHWHTTTNPIQPAYVLFFLMKPVIILGKGGEIKDFWYWMFTVLIHQFFYFLQLLCKNARLIRIATLGRNVSKEDIAFVKEKPSEMENTAEVMVYNFFSFVRKFISLNVFSTAILELRTSQVFWFHVKGKFLTGGVFWRGQYFLASLSLSRRGWLAFF